MGNAFSNPLDENKQARMNEIINEVVAVFAKVRSSVLNPILYSVI
jgi:hypothetical protein